ncbi:UPF0481 protein At3g47200-like isoform X2 [Vicia villosa]|uniref:UPF0481 protein At3g47200-like isoform X2 n=1 Tax=Vicia villosa TaxID=3911 RepID=UPI00273B4FBA|nr:UPF0481 protein At3g47200-like isoform X2 [Vicia villosa]
MMASQTTLKKKFVELREAKQIQPSSLSKIQKAPEYLRNRNDFEKKFTPKLVSIGPIHHDNKNLKLGENYKLNWATNYIQNTPHTPEFLHAIIADKIHELMDLFADDVLALANNAESLKGFSSLEEKLSWLLFVDGCFLLYILMSLDAEQVAELEHVDIMVDQFEDIDLANQNIKVDQLALVMNDAMLLENQLPYQVLKLLWKNDNEDELIRTMETFLKCYQPTLDIQQKLPNEPQPPTHLLDLHRKIILTKSNRKKQRIVRHSIASMEMPHWNIQYLREIGINLKSSQSQSLTDICFSESRFAAELTLPKILMVNSTTASLLNLIAYEMCPDFMNNYGICSFLGFMNTLIDNAEDVKILRSKGILGNLLGRDEEVAELFKNIGADLVCNPFLYSEVVAKIHEHHRYKICKIWLAQAYHIYLRNNPLAITGFCAAVTALSLTFLQTWLSIFPPSR